MLIAASAGVRSVILLIIALYCHYQLISDKASPDNMALGPNATYVDAVLVHPAISMLMLIAASAGVHNVILLIQVLAEVFDP